MKVVMMVAFCMTFNIAFSNDLPETPEVIGNVKNLLAQVESSAPERCRGDVYYFIEHFTSWRASPEFARLKETVSANWEEILGNLEAFATSSESLQYILFEAFSFLPQQTSFQCLGKIADLALNDAIRKEMFHWVVVSHAINNKHVLALNHKDPVVTEVLRKACIIDPEHRGYYVWIASGAARKEITSPFYYDMSTNTEPNLFSLKSWGEFIARPLIVLIIAIIGAVSGWRYFRKRGK